jgi:GT2 family glycosyltransferase
MIPLFIINYNGLENLGPLLFKVVEKAVEAYTHLGDLKIVFVDNGSRDGSLDAVVGKFGDVVLPIRIKSNLGHSMGVNVALKRYITITGSTPRYAFVMDNDYVILNPDGLRDLIRYMEGNHGTAALQGINLNRYGKVGDAGLLLTTFYTVIFRCGGLPASECPEKVSYVSSVIGCLALYNVRHILLKRGFTFNRYNIIYHDDVDLSLDMWSHGYSSAFIPVVIGVHYWSSTRKRMIRSFIEYESKRGAVLLYKRLSKFAKAKGLLTPYVRELLYTIPRLALYGRERTSIVTRAFLDAMSLKAKPLTGPYEPLILHMSLRTLPYSFIWCRLKHEKGSELMKLVIDKDTLRTSRRPFIISYTL